MVLATRRLLCFLLVKRSRLNQLQETHRAPTSNVRMRLTATLFVASLLHDLAWSPEYDQDDKVDFEVAGAQHALQFCKEHGLSGHRSRVIHEMIALHTSPNRLRALPPEVHLVSQGAGVDVAGFYAEEVHPSTLKSVVKAHPRHSFKRQCCHLMHEQCRRKPDSHIAGWCSMGFLQLVQAGPFDE